MSSTFVYHENAYGRGYIRIVYIFSLYVNCQYVCILLDLLVYIYIFYLSCQYICIFPFNRKIHISNDEINTIIDDATMKSVFGNGKINKELNGRLNGERNGKINGKINFNSKINSQINGEQNGELRTANLGLQEPILKKSNYKMTNCTRTSLC